MGIEIPSSWLSISNVETLHSLTGTPVVLVLKEGSTKKFLHPMLIYTISCSDII
jgi:hypothetical protein